MQAKPRSPSSGERFAIPNFLRSDVTLLLQEVRFSGRLSIVVQNGTVLKSGYEEGYFTRKDERRLT